MSRKNPPAWLISSIPFFHKVQETSVLDVAGILSVS